MATHSSVLAWKILGTLDNPEATYPITREDLEKCAARMITLAKRLG